MPTENFNLPLIADNMANDVVRDMNALAEATDGALKTMSDNKVDKVSGKQLSTNDYTTTEKNKLAGIASGANNTTVNNTLTSTSTTAALSAAQGKALKDLADGKASNTDLTALNNRVTQHLDEIASSSKLGHVKVGQGLKISADGTLKAEAQAVPNASTTVAGITKLNDSITSTSTTEAATPNAMKKVNDAKVNKAGDTMTGLLTISIPDTSAMIKIERTNSQAGFGYFGMDSGKFTFYDPGISSVIKIDPIRKAIELGFNRISSGSGSPEGAVTGVVGDLFLRSDGSGSVAFYVKGAGIGNTGWVAK